MQDRFGSGRLWLATGAAVGGALPARELGFVAAAAVVAAVVALALLQPKLRVLLVAAPAALAGVPLPQATPPSVTAGPVQFDGIVREASQPALLGPATACRVQCGGAEIRLLLAGAGGALLPGDRVTGIGRAIAREETGGALLVEAAADAVRVTSGAWSWPRAVAAVRLRMQQELASRVPGPSGPLLVQLVLGQGPRIDEALTEAHRATGLSHLLAVSGAHAAMLAFLLSLPFRRRLRRPVFDPRFRRTAMLLLLAYGALTGFEPPMFRAVAAFLLWLWAARSGRRVPPGALLAAPALLTALLAPADLLGVSFVLSYAAVAGLALAQEEQLARGPGLALRASFWAAATTSPICVHLFGQLAPCTIVATPLLAPIVAAMLGLGLLVPLVALVLAPLADLLALPLQLLAWGYAQALTLLDLLPGTPILAPAAPGIVAITIGILLGLLALAALRGRRGVLALCVLATLPAFLPLPSDPTPRVIVADAGHGAATLAVLPDRRVLLVDCGSRTAARRVARDVLAALAPRRRIDLLVLTHADADHHNALPFLLRGCDVAAAWLPQELVRSELAERLRACGTVVTGIAHGERRAVAGVCVAAPRSSSRASNDRGLWAMLELAGCRVLFPGDAQTPAIEAWLAESPQSCDLLLLPHHGRAEPAIEALLRVASPRLAIATTARGDPDPPQLAICRQLGIDALTTGACGTIRLTAGDPPRYTTTRARPLR